ncbi:hypothetical protein MFRU_021g00560 [Monilinia fructicola]|nr:hypothetical protein MFRU_021g00560 [Monilinia fructicola]
MKTWNNFFFLFGISGEQGFVLANYPGCYQYLSHIGDAKTSANISASANASANTSRAVPMPIPVPVPPID